MNIHEYQAKELLKSYGIPVPPGEVVYSDRAAARVAEELGGSRWVVKAQIHAGGRGKGGGVKLANSVGKVSELADQMIGSTLVTAQTGETGKRVHRVLIERASRIDREFYLSMIVDRVSQKIVVIASAEGGVEIEQVAADRPDAIHTEYVDPGVGLLDFQCRKVATAIGLAEPRRVVHTTAEADLPALPRQGLPAARDQPVHRDRGRRPGGARLQDAVRRQRAVPAVGRRRAPRLRRGGPEGGRCVRPRPQLRGAGRERRLHRERRGPRDGHDGRDRPPRRTSGELPRRRRRREPGEDRERVPDRAHRPERARRSS